MKAALTLSLLFVLAGVSHVSAQRNVTNADLEKFRQKRLAAERDYIDNYERMGFPSPEELERQIEQSRADSLALAERLAAERLERERMAIERERMAIERENLHLEREALDQSRRSYYGGGYFGFPGYYNLGGPILGGRGARDRWTRYNIGNGIPVVNYYGNPGRRSPAFRVRRNR